MILLFWQITGANLTRGKRDAHKHFFFFFFSVFSPQVPANAADCGRATLDLSSQCGRGQNPDPSVQIQTLAGKPSTPESWKKEFEAKLIWHCCFMKCDCIFFILFTRMLQPFELRSQPVPLLHVRIAVQTHFGGLCSTAQPPVKKKGCSDLRATAITFHLPAQPLRTLHDFRSCCLVCFYSLSHESCRDVLLFWPCVPCFGVFERDYRRREVFPDAIFLVLSVTVGGGLLRNLFRRKFNLFTDLIWYADCVWYFVVLTPASLKKKYIYT